MVIIGLDIGKKRTGIAKSDPMGIVIKPYKTALTDNLINELKAINEELGIEKFILGEPVNIEKGNNEAYDFVIKSKNLIEKSFPTIEVELIDERFTSKEAQATLNSQGKKINRNNKELIDMYAAAIILESYFNKFEE
jgi:putative Holliday junction resolvase